MTRLQRFANVPSNEGEQEEWYWNRNLLEEDLTCHAKKTGRHASKSKPKARKIQNRTTRNMQEDDFVED
jgi:hypothetical protein